jgi:predicted small lipoprotein YifL
MGRPVFLFIVAVAAAFFSGACGLQRVEVGELQTESRSVQGSARSATTTACGSRGPMHQAPSALSSPTRLPSSLAAVNVEQRENELAGDCGYSR